MKQATITINGRLYDAHTGEPVGGPARAATKPAPTKVVSDIAPRPAPAKANPHKHPSSHVHTAIKRSATLNRAAVRKPAANVAHGMGAHHSVATHNRSPLITRHAPTVVTPVSQVASNAGPAPEPQTTHVHPSVLAAMRHKAESEKTGEPLSSKELKEQLIKQRLAEVGNSEAPKKAGLFARRPRLASILASSLVLVILGGYFTYINLTNISMRVAASNAGIDASFPGYKPDGFSVNGPITYAPGEVGINYQSNTNNTAFTLTQKASNWDSQGVLDNYVRKQTSTYLTFQQRGVTVYTFANKAAWTNGGLLYTVEGDASLSSEQILKLATSL